MTPDPPLPSVELPSGRRVPALGIGTWRMGERPDRRTAEVAALRRALERGMTLVDTAEMYADGGAEQVVGEAIAGHRDRVTLVSKVLPTNASRRGVLQAFDRSRRRLGVDTIDLYLLHWRGRVPLAETVEAFERLRADGRITDWGVSNFDAADLAELDAVAGAAACATDQVYYALSQRGCEFDLLPAMAARRMPVMAYCPLDEGRLVDHPALRPIARELGATPAQVALAWLLAPRPGRPAVIAIPKTASAARVDENAGAASLRLQARHLEALDAAFPPPRRAAPLAMV